MNPILHRATLLHQLAELMKVRASNPDKYDPQIDEICKRLPRYDVPEHSTNPGGIYNPILNKDSREIKDMHPDTQLGQFDLTGGPDPNAPDRTVTGQTTGMHISEGKWTGKDPDNIISLTNARLFGDANINQHPGYSGSVINPVIEGYDYSRFNSWHEDH